MEWKITTSGPKLIGKVGEQKTSKIWHIYSHAGGGHDVEEKHIQSSCGFLKGCPWLSNGNSYDADKFWLCKPNKMFTIRNHTPGLCYVDHYYLALKIGPIVRIEFVGQFQSFDTHKPYKIYKIGDENRKPDFLDKVIDFFSYD